MFDPVGLSAKPGHLLKFKKAVAAYSRSPARTQGIDNSVPSTVTQKKVQKSNFFNVVVVNCVFSYS